LPENMRVHVYFIKVLLSASEHNNIQRVSNYDVTENTMAII